MGANRCEKCGPRARPKIVVTISGGVALVGRLCAGIGVALVFVSAGSAQQTGPRVGLAAGVSSIEGSLFGGYHVLVAAEHPRASIGPVALRLDGLVTESSRSTDVLLTGNVVARVHSGAVAPYAVAGVGTSSDPRARFIYGAGAGADFPVRSRPAFAELRLHWVSDTFATLSVGFLLR